MSRNAQIILALDEQRLNAYELAANLGCDLHAVRNSVQDLLLRCLITSSAKRVKFYSLTTLGRLEADRLRELGATRTKTPEAKKRAAELAWQLEERQKKEESALEDFRQDADAIVAQAMASRHPLTAAWGGA